MKQYTLILTLCVLVISKSNAQKQLNFGLKIHPNFSFSTIVDKSNFDKYNFSVSNGALGLNFGACVNYQKNKFLIEFVTGIHSNTTGIKFQHNAMLDELNITTLSYSNQLNLGYLIYSSSAPYYEIFYTTSFSYNIIGIFNESGHGEASDFTHFQEFYPNLDYTWHSTSIGTGIKIRTQLKNGRKLDYGVSYNFGLKKYPLMGMKVETQTEKFQSFIQPNISTLNIDFIYFFGKKRT